LLFSKGAFNQTAWHMAAREGHVEVLEKLWDLAKGLQLEPEELRNEIWFQRTILIKQLAAYCRRRKRR
jgi:hypothetical protein